jgi:hypothetical protein
MLKRRGTITAGVAMSTEQGGSERLQKLGQIIGHVMHMLSV